MGGAPAGYSEGNRRVFGGIRMDLGVFGSFRTSYDVAVDRNVTCANPPKYHLV